MDNRSKNSKKFILSKDLLLRANRKRSSLAASVTIEASLVIPLFLFFFANLLGVFGILKLQCDLEAALHQTGRQLMMTKATTSVLVSKGNKSPAGNAAAGAVDAVLAGKMVKSYLGDDYLKASAVVGGASGLKFGETTFYSDGDIIDIIATYKAHPLFGIAAFTNFPLEGRFYGHAFNGYNEKNGAGSNKAKEELVYITESGIAYHRSLDCSHLKISISQVLKADVTKKKNKNQGKYYPCEFCGKKAGNTVFITNYGNRYHSSKNCGAIKRTIKVVPISEAIGRTPCKECA